LSASLELFFNLVTILKFEYNRCLHRTGHKCPLAEENVVRRAGLGMEKRQRPLL